MLEMRNSERGALKACQQKWYWQIVEGLRPKRAANPLWFGSAVHEGLAAWYEKGFKRGPHPAETFSKFLEGERSILVTNEDQEKEYFDARALGIDMLESYVKFYDNDDSWDVIATERQFRVRMARPKTSWMGATQPAQKSWLRFVGTWDGVYRDAETGAILLMEHKTAASIWDEFLPLDDQASTYPPMANIVLRKEGILAEGETIAGINYNFLRKAKGDSRPVNERGMYTNLPRKEHFIAALEGSHEIGGFNLADLKELAEAEGVVVFGDESKSQPPPRFERHLSYRSQVEQKKALERIKWEAMLSEALRNGDLPINKSPSLMHCRFCDFRRMCQLDEEGDADSVEEFKEFQYVRQSPYAEHERKSAE